MPNSLNSENKVGWVIVMPLKYTLKDERGYLLITVSGSPDCTEEMFQYIDSIFREIKHRGYPSVLVDESQANLRFEILNAVFKKKIPSLDVDFMQIVHIAIISASHSLELYKFFEGVLANRHFHFKAFDNFSRGEEWLCTTAGANLDQSGNYSYEVSSDKEYVRINLFGKINEVNDMLVLAGEIIRETSVHNSTCILLDGRNADVELDVSQAFKIAQTLGDYIPLLGLRIASIPKEKQKKLDQFFETVFQNRSINYRTFELEKEAEAWLKARRCRPQPAA